MVAAAVIGGAALSTAGSVGTGLMQSGNANRAAATSQRNLQLILPQMQQNYAQGQNQLAPLISTGMQGTTASADLLGLNGPDAAAAAMQRFQTSPGYEWQMQQGLRGVDAGAAAAGMLRSGATLKAEDTFAQGLANTDFGQYFSRLTGLSTLGDTAIGQSINAGNSLISGEEGNAQSQNALAIGGATAQNSILGNTAGGIGNTLNSLLQNKDVQSTLSGLFGSGSTGTNLPGTSGYNPNLTVGGYSAADNSFFPSAPPVT